MQDRVAKVSLNHWPAQPVRVALVITDIDVGGAERAMINLATRLDHSRWALKVFALGNDGHLGTVLREAAIPYVCLGCTNRRPVQVIRRLSRAFREFQPEIVQSFLFHANLASRLAALCAGRPWVVGGIRVAEHEKRWHLVLDWLTAPLSTGSVCVSQGVMDFTRDIAGINPRRLAVIPNGIDPAPFDAVQTIPRKDLGIPEEAHLALFVGRLDVQKGIGDLLTAAEWVIAQCPAWHLALAGNGPCRIWLLEQIATRPKLTGRIHWLGNRDDIPGLLRAADVLVLPSLWEGMPNVILEAMAASRPVIATSVEGSSEVVIGGETGWLVPVRDPESLGAAMLNAAIDPQRCRVFGLNGRERVYIFFIDQTVAAYDWLWSQILGYKTP